MARPRAENSARDRDVTSYGRARPSDPAERLEQLEIGERQRDPRLDHGDVALLEELREADAIEERDRRRARRRRLFARARQALPRRDEPPRRRVGVVVQRAAQVDHALAADLAAVAA